MPTMLAYDLYHAFPIFFTHSQQVMNLSQSSSTLDPLPSDRNSGAVKSDVRTSDFMSSTAKHIQQKFKKLSNSRSHPHHCTVPLHPAFCRVSFPLPLISFYQVFIMLKYESFHCCMYSYILILILYIRAFC